MVIKVISFLLFIFPLNAVFALGLGHGQHSGNWTPKCVTGTYNYAGNQGAEIISNQKIYSQEEIINLFTKQKLEMDFKIAGATGETSLNSLLKNSKKSWFFSFDYKIRESDSILTEAHLNEFGEKIFKNQSDQAFRKICGNQYVRQHGNFRQVKVILKLTTDEFLLRNEIKIKVKVKVLVGSITKTFKIITQDGYKFNNMEIFVLTKGVDSIALQEQILKELASCRDSEKDECEKASNLVLEFVSSEDFWEKYTNVNPVADQYQFEEHLWLK